MLKTIKNLITRVSIPDALDMVEHYQTRSERLADLWVHLIGLGLAAVGGIVLAVLAAIYGGFGAVFSTAIYAMCLIAMPFCAAIAACSPALRQDSSRTCFPSSTGSGNDTQSPAANMLGSLVRRLPSTRIPL